MTVLLAVGQQQMVRAHLETILYAGLNPVAIDVEPLAAARALLVDGYSELTVALINIGAVKTDISIFERGLLVLPRTVFVAGDNFTRAVSDATGQPMEQAERLKRLYAEIPPSRTGVPEEGAAAESVGAFDLGGLEQEIEEGVYGVEDEEVAPAPTVRFSLDDVDTGGGDLGFDFDIGKRAEEEPSPSEPAKPSEAETHPVAPVDSESELKKKVVDAVLPVFSELVMELRRSFDYYQGRNPDARIDRVILCGGTAMMKGLPRALEEELGIPVEVADLSKRYGLMSKSLSAGYYSEVAPVLPVGIGLAVRDMVETNGASRGRRQR
jgi:type IV pilus assembly protein PilM